MKLFHCEHCGSLVFFENDQCLKCGRTLGFVPEILEMMTFQANGEVFSRDAGARRGTYRQCGNRRDHRICNWMVPAEDSQPLCMACRLNETIPNLSVAGNLERWRKLEVAKRRCLYTLLRLKLPVNSNPSVNYPPLRFRFLADVPGGQPVKTGHDAGVVTLNVAEADDDERERRKLNLQEPYRALVGHFRHELGHYYWEVLVSGTPALTRCRELFGDETVDYQTALQTYYQQGPTADWPDRTVSAYASSHPWEDWAETWAHYLHLLDTFEIATAFGMILQPEEPAAVSMNATRFQKHPPATFDELLKQWFPLTCALNSFNRGMGLPDLYPFVTPPAAVEKMRFIHQLTQGVPVSTAPPAIKTGLRASPQKLQPATA